jgi:hypothetical protein
MERRALNACYSGMPACLSLPQALPNGHVSPALFVALRVLCASDKEAAGWGSFEDALKLPAAAAVAADAAGSGGGEGEAEAGGQPELGAVQVWTVLDADGQPQPAAASEEQSQQGYAALLNASMCQLLQGEVQQRLAAYAGTLQEDLQQLQEQQQGAAAAAATAGDAAASQAESEQRVAERAALVLRITEKEVLHNLLIALEHRLAALPAEQPAAGKAGCGPQRKNSSSGGQKRKQR